MKKTLLMAGLICGFSTFLSAQTIEEPEFVGETTLVKQDNTSSPLEKTLAQNRTVASTGLILTGIGKVRSQIQIDGCCANLKVSKNEEVKLIVRNVDNQTDPLAIIQVFKFEVKKKYRRAELAAISSLGSAKSNNLLYVPFKGKKYGASSYILTLSALQPGEYGITISNPNSLDQKQIVVSTFAVSE